MHGNVIWDSISQLDFYMTNGSTVYVNGTSAYTITVGSYNTSVDLSGASGTDNWSSYAVEKPSELGGNSSSSSSSGSTFGSTDTSSSGSNSTDSSNSSDTNPTTGDNAPIKIAASMGTIIIAAGAVYVVYNKKKSV
jgi:hypothetical protein